jgi:hypothetical protein
VPDVLALESRPARDRDWSGGGRGGVALATEPPKTRFVSRASEEAVYAAKANRVAVHRNDEDGDQIIAVIEILSPGNKSGSHALQDFVNKSLEYLDQGIHLLVIDLFPPTPRDPQGIHGAIWGEVTDEPFELPPDKRLTLASYVAALPKMAYVEPVAPGDGLADMPVFLDTRTYVRVPLEETYSTTWRGCPEEFKGRVESRS